MEFEHYLLDNPDLNPNKEQYADPAYEEWERQAQEEDRGVSL